MTISIRYPQIKRKDGVEKRLPYIKVELKGQNSGFYVETYALLDSGADISVIPKDFAELIGVRMKGEIMKANGLGGEVKVINSKMELKIRGDHRDYVLNIPVQVVLDESKIPVILGRDGFFSYFRIEFDHANQRVRMIVNDEKNLYSKIKK